MLTGQNARIQVESGRSAMALDVTLRGTGTLEHSGTPALTQQIAGTGTIRQRSP